MKSSYTFYDPLWYIKVKVWLIRDGISNLRLSNNFYLRRKVLNGVKCRSNKHILGTRCVAVELDQLDSKLISSDHQPDGIGEV
jgi:hypothetical protein